MLRGLVYKNRFLYESAMIGLYGRNYAERYRAIAELIEPESSVLDLCCGPGVLFTRYLSKKRVRYTGIDMNEAFVRSLQQRGVAALRRDLKTAEPLPAVDTVVMQASLYHFLPDPNSILERMVRAAQVQVVIAEPVRNMTDASSSILSAVSKLVTDPGDGRHTERFSEPQLDDVIGRLATKPAREFLIRGGREKVYVIPTTDCLP